MQVRDLSHPKNSKSLNESVAKNYGYKLNLDKFSDEQLKQVRDNLIGELAKFESTNSYNAVYENTQYQKNRALLDVVTQTITERSELTEKAVSKAQQKFMGMVHSAQKGKKPASPEVAKAAKGMSKKDAKDFASTKHKGLPNHVKESILREGEEEKAALIMSSRDMVDKLTGWLEDVASLKAETLLELLDSIRDEMGNDISQQFSSKVKPSLEEVYNCLEKNRQTLAQAVAILTGEEGPGEGMDVGGLGAGGDMTAAEPGLGGEMGAEEVPALPAPEESREKRESIEYSRKIGILLNSKKK